MLLVIVAIATSVLLPLFCCFIPPLARFTVFPLLTKLVYRFTGNYIHSCLRLDFWIGTFNAQTSTRKEEGNASHQSKIRGFSLAAHDIKCKKSWLSTFALDKKAIAPIQIEKVEINCVTIHIASTWHIVFEVDDVKVMGSVLQPAALAALEINDVIALKLKEAANWSEIFQEAVEQELKENEGRKQFESQIVKTSVSETEGNDQSNGTDANCFGLSPARKFTLKDRVLQMIFGQIEVRVKNVDLVLKSSSVSMEETNKSNGESILKRVDETSPKIGLELGFSLEKMELRTVIHSDREDHALDDLLMSSQVKVAYKAQISKISISERKGDKLDKETRVDILSIPIIGLDVSVPPIPRLLGLVDPDVSPIPYLHRQGRVDVMFDQVETIQLQTQVSMDILQAFCVPFLNNRTSIDTLKQLADEQSRGYQLNEEDREFYITHCQKTETTSKLSAAEKQGIAEKIYSIESNLLLDDILKLRDAAHGWSRILNASSEVQVGEGVSTADLKAMLEHHSAKPEFTKFAKMEATLRVKKVKILFSMRNYEEVAHMLFENLGGNLTMTTHPSDTSIPCVEADLTLEQTSLVAKRSDSITGGVDAAADRLFYADTAQEDDTRTARMITMNVQLFSSGLQAITADVSDLTFLLKAEPLESFLLFVANFSSRAIHSLSIARPVTDVNALETSTPQQSVFDLPHLAPFTILGGRELQVKAAINNVRLLLLPTAEFDKLHTPHGDARNSTLRNCLDIPITIQVGVKSSADEEEFEIDITEFGILAQYKAAIPSDDDNEHHNESVLTPAAYGCRYRLEQDTTDAFLALADITFRSPDVTIGFSNQSVTLAASCWKALQSIHVTTNEQQRLKVESEIRQGQLREQTEMDVAVERIRRLWKQVGSDESGRVSFDDLMQLVRHAHIGEDLLTHELVSFMRDLYATIDHDGRGNIEFAEMDSFLRSTLTCAKLRNCNLDRNGDLYGSLDLRAGEYTSFEEVSKIAGKRIDTEKELGHTIALPTFIEQFWTLYETETRQSRNCIESSYLTTQKKLVRLLKNYRAAELVWSSLISPELKKNDRPVLDWMLKSYMHCGGSSEYMDAISVLTRKKREELFAVRASELEEAEVEILCAGSGQLDNRQGQSETKKLRVSTRFEIGAIESMLLDTDIPSKYSRANLFIGDVCCSISFFARDIIPLQKLNVAKILSAESTEWAFLFSAKISSTFYNDLVESVEYCVEPWQVLAGLSSEEGESGVSVLMEAQERFQINVSPSLLKVYQSISELVDDNVEKRMTEQVHEPHNLPGTRSRLGDEILIQNLTGSTLKIGTGEGDPLELEPNGRVYTREKALTNPPHKLKGLEIVNYGQLHSSILLPSYGNINAPIRAFDNGKETLHLTISCRLEDPLRRCITFKSSVYIANATADKYTVHYDTEGYKEAKPIELRSGGHHALPISVLMGSTAFKARPEHFQDWIVKAKMSNEFFVSEAVVREIEIAQESKDNKLAQRKGGAIVYGETEDSSATFIKQLSPTVILRRWHLRTHFEWELCILPAFVLRNSLPYRLEYRFLEYQVQTTKWSPRTLLEKVESELHAGESDNVVHGTIESGQDAEVSEISCMLPGYLCVRLVATTSVGKMVSPWSRALLMAVHGAVDHFPTKREIISVSKDVQFNMDRLTDSSHPRMVRFSVSYWIVNNTSLDLMYSPKNAVEVPQSAEFRYPVITELPENRLRLRPAKLKSELPQSWTAIGSISDSIFAKIPLNDQILENSTWCDPINTTAISTEGECVCGANVIAVKIEGLYGVFESTIALTLSPRYFVQNRLKQDIWLQVFSSSESSSEKVMDPFKKRNAEDVSRVRIGLKDDEIVPLYHFASLRKDSTAKANKFMSISFTEKWDHGNGWSFVIPLTVASDMYFQLYSPTRKQMIICLASIQIVDMYVYVILSDVSTAPPYRIENYTPFSIEYCQLGSSGSLFSGTERESKEVVKSGRWRALAWHNPASKERMIEVRVTHCNGKTLPQKLDLDYVGYQTPLKIEIPTEKTTRCSEISVQVFVAENTRVLKLIEKDVELRQFESQEAELVVELQQRKVLYASVFDIRFLGIGLSLFDALPQEILLISVDLLQIQKSASSLAWKCSIFHCQVDNMLSTARFPVILNPLNSGFSVKSTNEDAAPLFQISLEADLSAKIGIFKLLDVNLGSICVKIDLDYVFSLVKLLDPYFSSSKMILATSRRMREKTLKRTAPSMTLFSADENIRSNAIYFDLLRIHALSVDLEYILTRKDIVSTTQGGSHSVVFGLLSQVVGLIGSNLGGSPYLRFNQIVIARCFSTKERLKNQLIQNFVRQAVVQAYRLIGSADIIGDPIGLVEDLGSGVIEFFKITKDEVTGDAQTRGEGVRVLGKTLAKSGADTITKITGSLDRFIGEFADEETAHRNSDCSEDSSPGTTGIGVLDGGLKFAKDFGKGVTGIITKPVEGAMKRGVTGLMQGAVQGIAGPGVVILKQITSTTHSLALGVQSTVVDRSPFGGRRRYVKPTIRKDSIDALEHDETESKPTEMVLEVIAAKELVSGRSTDASCVVELDGRVILKTKTLYNTCNPTWQEKTAVELKGSEKKVQLEVRDTYGGTIERAIGQSILTIEQLRKDFRPPKYGSDLAKWVMTGVKPGDTSKNSSHHVREKQYPLLKPAEASTKDRMAELYEVAITVSKMHHFDTSTLSASNFGMGALIRRDHPNLSPYVIISMGQAMCKTETAKPTYASPLNGQHGEKECIATSEWNQTFTFVYDPSRRTINAQFVVKDKSTFHDGSLANATLNIPTESLKESNEMNTLKLYSAEKDKEDQCIGYLDVRMRLLKPPKVKTEHQKPLEGVVIGKICIACDFR